jgi:DNA end-binding protein Ku
MLRAEVLRYADELRTPETVGLPQAAKPDAARVRALAKEIDALAAARIDPAELADLEAETLREFAAKKAKSGEGVVSMAELEGDEDDGAASAQVIDLMQVLRESLGASVGKGKGDGAAEADAPARKPAVRKTSAAKTTGAAANGTAATKRAAPRKTAKTTATRKPAGTKKSGRAAA